MRPYRHRRSPRRRLSRAARTLLLTGWFAVTFAMTELGLPAHWAAAIFFLGPVAVFAAPLARWSITGASRRLRQAGPGWSLAVTALIVAVAAFFAVLWLPWSLPMPAPQAQPFAVTAPPASTPSFSCRVSGVHDGDTLRCADGTRVRLHAVAARESDETCSKGHPCPTASGAAARLELVKLAENQILVCRRTGRSYDRVTAICANESGVEINCAMVRSGTALIWDRYHRRQPLCRART